MSTAKRTCDVAVIGGGPAGLTAATRLREAGAGRVVVLEREAEPGGIPRHCDHQGYGIRDLRRVMSGPRYANVLAERAVRAGAEILTSTQVTGWGAPGELELTAPAGRSPLLARAVVLATGCRERPRPARWIAGSRPSGVMTTGTLQQRVHFNHEELSGRAVVIGAEHVAFSALQTLRHGGARPVAMTTELPRHQSYLAFRLGAAVAYRVPLWTRTRLTRIIGSPSVEAVELLNLETGVSEIAPCEIVVFTGDWIPDHELAVMAGVELDRMTRGPRVDLHMRTSQPGVFAAGNVLHGAETADVAALAGARVTAGVLAHLGGEPWPSEDRITIGCEEPLSWIVPGAVSARELAAAGGAFRIRATRDLVNARITIAQGGRMISRERLLRLGPARSARLGSGWLSRVDSGKGPVSISLSRAR